MNKESERGGRDGRTLDSHAHYFIARSGALVTVCFQAQPRGSPWLARWETEDQTAIEVPEKLQRPPKPIDLDVDPVVGPGHKGGPSA